MQDSVNSVLANIVRNQNGKNLLYQCRPTISHSRAKSISRTVFDNLTINDVLQRQRTRKQMINTVLVHK